MQLPSYSHKTFLSTYMFTLCESCFATWTLSLYIRNVGNKHKTGIINGNGIYMHCLLILVFAACALWTLCNFTEMH